MLLFTDLGKSPYEKTWNLQKIMQRQRINNEIHDTVLFVEHEPVYTFGKNANEDHLLQNYPTDVKLFHIERGGDITFHGPGQLVGYPILDLHRYQLSISWYMRSLEEVVIQTLRKFNIKAERKSDLTGVWVKNEKIAALGVRISRWVTMHGFALNVNTDLSYYENIIPCGIFNYGVTSMEKFLKKEQDMEKVKKVLISVFSEVFQSKMVSG
ncbi:MAG: lipoyl(octanoyl) transferase [Candidatus Marinimicrobia bacterium]|nr:lipoyl(octanoyl) transferase [Candidatus Neomarinimicrobiota bacterium]|tara:strand:+ start:97806 stop:98438 length:633 start_codon:yes stop_codon:yes gene_type:complete